MCHISTLVQHLPQQLNKLATRGVRFTCAVHGREGGALNTSPVVEPRDIALSILGLWNPGNETETRRKLRSYRLPCFGVSEQHYESSITKFDHHRTHSSQAGLSRVTYAVILIFFRQVFPLKPQRA